MKIRTRSTHVGQPTNLSIPCPGRGPAGILWARTLALVLLTAVYSVASLAASTDYNFSTATDASLTDMSSGTTQLVGPSADDTASAVTNIGFEFYLLGTRYTQFSVSSNGYMRLGPTAVTGGTYALGAAGSALIASLGSDNMTSASGRVHYKLEGVAPNRVLVVEFQNMTIIYTGAPGVPTPDGTSQVRLYETTGVIELVYGPMARNNSTGFNGGLDAQHIGFSFGNTAGAIASIDTDNVLSTAGPTPNQFPLGQPMASLDSASNDLRRIYRFAPAVPTAPTDLTFASVTPLGMTVQWTDSPDESLYAVYRSLDGVNYSFQTTLPQNSTSFVASGLNPSTVYFWQVYAISDGAVSTALGGSQSTTPAGEVSCSGAGGNWDDLATWTGGSVPAATDNVTIGAGCTVTVNVTTAAAFNVTIDSGGTLQSPAAGAVINNNLTVGGSVTNEGTLDFSTNANTSAAILTFGAGSTDVSLTGSGAITDVRTIAVSKGSQSTVVTLSPSTFTVQGVNTDVAAFLTLTSGTLRVGGTFAMTNRLFTPAGYTIPAAAALWLDNPNFTVAGQGSSPINGGLLRISAGSYNVGTGAGNTLGATAGGRFLIEGGTLTTTGRLQSTAAVSYTQTGGLVQVCTMVNTAGTACFGLTAATNTFDFAGGAIALIQPSGNATPLDYSVSTGATFVTNPALTNLILGTGASPPGAAYRVLGATPSVQVTPGRTMHVGSGTAGGSIFFRGSTLLNDGTIAVQGTGTSSRLDFAASGPMTYQGTGVFGTAGTPFAGVGISANSPTVHNTTVNAPIFVNRVNFFNGGFANSAQLTLGGGGASTVVVQMGNSTTPSNAGGFDVAPAFNLGTGGQIMLYLRQISPRVTGGEINPGRVLSTLTIDENGATNSVTLTGGDLSVSTALNLTNGRFITGANTLSSGIVAVARTNGYVDGNLLRTAGAAGPLTFNVGTANGYSPVSFNVTDGTFPTDITATAVQATAPGFTPAALAIGRHWSLDANGITADLTFTYLDPTDLDELDETALRVYRGVMGVYTDLGGTIDTAANTATLTGVTTFSEWTLAGELVGELDIDPVSVDFGDTVVGDTSATATVTLSNIGFASLDVTGLDAAAAPFARSGGTCDTNLPIAIAAGDSCTLVYSFAPTATGPALQSIAVTANVAGSGTIELSGNGVQGNLVIDPTAVDFGDVLVGSTSATSTVTLSNTGTASLDVTTLTAAGAPFARNGGTCADILPISIAAGANCTLVYQFSPSVTGVANQTLTVSADAPGSGSILLEGNGVQGTLVIDPVGIDFGDVRVGSGSAPETVTLSNSGTADLEVTSLTIAAAPFTQTAGTCGQDVPFTIAVGANCTLVFTYSPTVEAASDQTLSVGAGIAGSGTIQLVGNGVVGVLGISPASFDFGIEVVGEVSALGTITLSNSGTVPLEVTSITLAALPFLRTADGTCGNALPFTIADGGSCTLSYTFAPDTAGAAQQDFSVDSDANGDTTFELVGTGVPAEDAIFADGFEPIP